MAYVSGTAIDITELRNSIFAACVANGWTLSGNVLHKGTAYIEGVIVAGFIEWRGGTGKDVSNALTGAAPYISRTGSGGQIPMTFPCNYEVHIFTNPDEVYVAVNYSAVYYQHIWFGLSNVPALPGTGMYFSSFRFTAANYLGDCISTLNGGTSNNAYGGCPAFWATAVGQNCQNSYIHHGTDARTWTDSTSHYPMSFAATSPLLAILPNAWNNETVLLPFQVYVPRAAGNKVSLVADLKNVRHCRITNHDPGEIITLGPDKWKMYPWYKKDAANPSGFASNDSGTTAWAVRYTGP